jgi:ubiquilin
MGGGGGGATAGGSTGYVFSERGERERGIDGIFFGSRTPAALFNPWAPTPAAAPPTAGLQNPFAGGAGGGAADLQRMMAQMYGAGGPAGGFGGFGGGGGASPAAPAGPQVSAEERYQSQLETLAGMGFVDAGRNVRALMASGGNVEGAIEWLFSN